MWFRTDATSSFSQPCWRKLSLKDRSPLTIGIHQATLKPMPPLTTWNIYDSDGSYLGQSAAFAAHTAFCKFMSLLGKGIVESDVRSEMMTDESVKLVYGREQFLLSAQSLRPPTN